MTYCELAQALGSIFTQDSHSTVLPNLPSSKMLAVIVVTQETAWGDVRY